MSFSTACRWLGKKWERGKSWHAVLHATCANLSADIWCVGKGPGVKSCLQKWTDLSTQNSSKARIEVTYPRLLQEKCRNMVLLIPSWPFFLCEPVLACWFSLLIESGWKAKGHLKIISIVYNTIKLLDGWWGSLSGIKLLFSHFLSLRKFYIFKKHTGWGKWAFWHYVTVLQMLYQVC